MSNVQSFELRIPDIYIIPFLFFIFMTVFIMTVSFHIFRSTQGVPSKKTYTQIFPPPPDATVFEFTPAEQKVIANVNRN